MHDIVPTGNGDNGGRDPATGRFVEGWRGGPGRQKSDWHKFRVWLVDELNKPSSFGKLTRYRRVIDRFLTAAENGEPWAVKEVLDRCMGKAIQPVDLGGVNLGTIQIIVERSADPQD